LTADGHESFDEATKHLKEEYRPQKFTLKGYGLARTLVRKMIPRNPTLDAALAQTCHFFSRTAKSYINDASNDAEEDHILVMIPHVTDVFSIPFYHPKVRSLALRYLYMPSASKGTLSIYFNLFPSHSLDTRLERTALNLLTIIHKHATGQASGYTKRVHHDQILPQNRFQDTYTRLKLKYAKALIANWAEQTDPTKHVFEDLGIAAFLIELWKDMYPETGGFPGFVDIGCGNGVLGNILLQEGYCGWGFDARARKSWATFPASVQKSLSAKILVPSVVNGFLSSSSSSAAAAFHDGIFPPGTFIISNHADELTPWTPLLAYLNRSPFIAIPCCSHNLAGARCRYNVREKEANCVHDTAEPTVEARVSAQDGPGPSSGSLARPKNLPKQPSAYQSLTTYVSNLAEELGFNVQKEMLRIPSTRNAAIVGRWVEQVRGDYSNSAENSLDDIESRLSHVAGIVHREVGDISKVAKDWLSQAEKVSKGTSSGH
jgi:tRNASer (uridine44-2'-O)-methyltransferase